MVQSASGRQRYRIAVAKIQEDAGVRVGRPGEPVELALVYLGVAGTRRAHRTWAIAESFIPGASFSQKQEMVPQ